MIIHIGNETLQSLFFYHREVVLIFVYKLFYIKGNLVLSQM